MLLSLAVPFYSHLSCCLLQLRTLHVRSEVRVCSSIHLSLSFSLHLDQGSDYRVRDPTLRFGACAMRQCLTVDIIDNNLIEDAETFTLTLKHPHRGSTDDIVLDPTVATVTIKDEDGAFVGTIYLTFTLQSAFSVLSLQ